MVEVIVVLERVVLVEVLLVIVLVFLLLESVGPTLETGTTVTVAERTRRADEDDDVVAGGRH